MWNGRAKWYAVVKTVTSLRLSQNTGNFWRSWVSKWYVKKDLFHGLTFICLFVCFFGFPFPFYISIYISFILASLFYFYVTSFLPSFLPVSAPLLISSQYPRYLVASINSPPPPPCSLNNGSVRCNPPITSPTCSEIIVKLQRPWGQTSSVKVINQFCSALF